MTQRLEPVDWLTIKKKLADVEKGFREKQREYERHAKSEQKGLQVHAEYWARCAVRCGEQADYVGAIWKAIP